MRHRSQLTDHIYRSNTRLVVLLAIQYPQNRQEEVDHVQVQADRRRDLLLNMIVSHDKLRVNQDVAAEDERSDNTVAELEAGRLREEPGHEAEEDEDPEGAEEVGHP